MSNEKRLIVAIDGPAGVGKSTAARLLAERLGWRFLDTGALYRAVTLRALRAGLDPHDEGAMAALAEAAEIELRTEGDRRVVLLDGEDVSAAIRGPDVTKSVSEVARLAGVRRAMVRVQRAFAAGGRVVAEGRDIGTVVFPDAGVKFFLTAPPRVRAARRAAEAGDPDVARVEAEIGRRDEADAGREESPLRPAADAVRVDTADRTADEVLDVLERKVRDAFASLL